MSDQNTILSLIKMKIDMEYSYIENLKALYNEVEKKDPKSGEDLKLQLSKYEYQVQLKEQLYKDPSTAHKPNINGNNEYQILCKYLTKF